MVVSVYADGVLLEWRIWPGIVRRIVPHLELHVRPCCRARNIYIFVLIFFLESVFGQVTDCFVCFCLVF